MEPFEVFKATTEKGTDFHTRRVQYTPGEIVEVADPDPQDKGECGRGLHVAQTPREAVTWALKLRHGREKYRVFRALVAETDVIVKDSDKWRVRRLRVGKELQFHEMFPAWKTWGIDEGKRITEAAKSIPWLQPTERPDENVAMALVQEFLGGLNEFRASRRFSGVTIKFVESRAAAAADAAAAAAAAAADAYRLLWRLPWYVRPRYTIWRAARIAIFLPDRPNPYRALIEMWSRGWLPLGIVGGVFHIYVPRGR